METESLRPAWAEIDLGAVKGNIAALRDIIGSKPQICAVVKADAYGHGAVEVARSALSAGASILAVALGSEAIRLREAGIAAPILVLGAPRPEEAPGFVANDLEATVFDEATIAAFREAARRAGSVARLHLKVDTGMSRVGCAPAQAPRLAALIAGGPSARLAGVYSHFAGADDPDLTSARSQLSVFLDTCHAIEARGIEIPIRHIANSAAALWLPEARLDMVRCGIAMYGLRPDAARPFPNPGFRAALSIRAKVVMLKEIPEAARVSYGGTWKAKRASRIATIPVGYADGYPRSISGRCWAGAGELRLPQVGRICMDMSMFDATETPDIREGSILTLMGPGGPSIDEVGALAGSFNYEIACHAALRLPRRYIEPGGIA